MYNGIKFTEDSDMEKIAETSFRILYDCGVSVEHEKFAKTICAHNPQKIHLSGKRVYIDTAFARDHFMSFKGSGPAARQPGVSAAAEIYNGLYLDPYDGEFKNWTEERFLGYVKLAKRLPDVGSVSMLGIPMDDVPIKKKPLLEKLYAFKYGINSPSSIWDTSLCPAIYRIWEIYAKERGANIADVFSGAVYLMSPLKMGYIESEQIMWFRERGLKVGVGNMPSVGLSAPVTLAGGLALHIAELLFLSIMREALYGDRYLGLGSSISVADMQTCAYRFGRPERLLLGNALSDIAAYYNMPFWGCAGLSDAKTPSYEAGVQKVSAALVNIMKGQHAHIAAGLLAVDEVYSPAQMVLDNEATGYLKRFCRGFEVGETELALETVKECVREGSIFAAQPHTAENARSCLWEPELFSRETFGAWQKDTDLDRAREVAISIIEGPELETFIGESCEGQILEIIGNC